MRPGVSARIALSAILFAAVPYSLVSTGTALAQAAVAKTDIADTWQGTLHIPGKDLRNVVKITKGADGKLSTKFYFIDQGGSVPVTTTTLHDGDVTMDVDMIGGMFTGKLSPDGNTITGEWKQGDKPLPLILVRATTETAWAIPEPPKAVPLMDPNADPTWEVATIKLSPPDAKGKNFGGSSPRQFKTRNTTMNDMVTFSFDLSLKQLVNAPAWFETEHFDVSTGEPDAPGAPNEKQMKSMLRKLLIERFGLKFHTSKQEMSAFVLTVAKDGPKMAKSEGDHRSGAFYFTKLGNLVYRDNSMQDFCRGMQAWVFDRPVVDRTNLTGNFDGTLKWSPDETQFQAFGAKIVPNEAADAPPPIFTAIQQQMGLKLESLKTPVDVMIIDRAEKPSDN